MVELEKEITKGNISEVEKFLQNGGDANGTTTEGRTFLTYSCIKGKLQICELLIKYGANIDVTTKDYAGPIHYVAFANHIPLLKFLIANNANPNLQYKPHGYTALHLASEYSNLEATELLLKMNNIDCSLKRNDGKTAADLAKDELIKKLIERKVYEKKKRELDDEIPKLKLAALKATIEGKEAEISDLADKSRKLMEEIESKFRELEAVKTNYQLARIELSELQEKQKISTSVPVAKYFTLVDSLLECPYCCEIPYPPRRVLQCHNGHPYCDLCSEKPNMQRCPTCKLPLDHKNRCLTLENMIAEKMDSEIPNIDQS